MKQKRKDLKVTKKNQILTFQLPDMTGKIVAWPNRGRDRPTQPKEKVPRDPVGNGQVLVPELDIINCNDAIENQAQAGAQTADAQPGGVQAVAAQPGANPDQIRRIIGPREFPVQRKN